MANLHAGHPVGRNFATLVSVNELLACRERKALPDYNGLITNLVDSVALTDLCVRNYPVKSVRLYGHCKIKNFNKPVLAPIRLAKSFLEMTCLRLFKILGQQIKS